MTSGSMFGICMSPKGEAPRPVNVEGLGVGGMGGIGSLEGLSGERTLAASEVVLLLDAGLAGVWLPLVVAAVAAAGTLLVPERTT